MDGRTGGRTRRQKHWQRERDRERSVSQQVCQCAGETLLHMCLWFPNRARQVTARVQTAQTARRALSVMLPAVLAVSFCVCFLECVVVLIK